MRSSALKPGGLLIFDTQNRDALLKDMRPYSVIEKDGNLMIDRLSLIACRAGFITNGL